MESKFLANLKKKRPTLTEMSDTFFRFFAAEVGVHPEHVDEYLSSDEPLHPLDAPPSGLQLNQPQTGKPLKIYGIARDHHHSKRHAIEGQVGDLFAFSCDYLYEHVTKLTGGLVATDPVVVSESIGELTDSLYDYTEQEDGRTDFTDDAHRQKWVEANQDRVRDALKTALTKTSEHYYADPNLLIDGSKKARSQS